MEGCDSEQCPFSGGQMILQIFYNCSRGNEILASHHACSRSLRGMRCTVQTMLSHGRQGSRMHQGEIPGSRLRIIGGVRSSICALIDAFSRRPAHGHTRARKSCSICSPLIPSAAHLLDLRVTSKADEQRNVNSKIHGIVFVMRFLRCLV